MRRSFEGEQSKGAAASLGRSMAAFLRIAWPSTGVFSTSRRSASGNGTRPLLSHTTVFNDS
eukprot:4045894-Prymnesium_polylepis.1